MNIGELNNMQKEAVLYNEGPLLILAGAGSGKTKVLTTKVSYLINELNVPPSQILAITFTNKAAKEMKERISSLVGPLAYQAQISTFHSFGLKIVKEYSDLLDLKRNFSILDTEDSLAIIKSILKTMNLDAKIYKPNTLKRKISSSKNEFIMHDKYEGFCHTPFDLIVAKVYKAYQEKLASNNAVDFDDLLILPLKLFHNFPNILSRYQDEYAHIMIDEYQDTNYVQYLLAKMISAKHRNITVVGDIDQAIYSFRGADYKNLLDFERDYTDAKLIKLEQNYRSTQNILTAANNVILNNKERKDKNLWSEQGEGEKIVYRRAYDEKDEANYIVGEISNLLANGYLLSDIAILYRTNAQSRNIEEAFLRKNIPYKVIGSFYFYKRKEIKDLISYLKLIYNSLDDTSLTRVINVPKRKIGASAIGKLSAIANERKSSLFEAIESGPELEFKRMIQSFQEATNKLSLTELISKILDESGLLNMYKKSKKLEDLAKGENLEEFKSISLEFERKNGNIDLGDFLEEISLVSDSAMYNNNSNVVTMMTIHAVKGLEFDVVFLAGAEENILPHSNSLMDSTSVEEERRLCYVAITRARKKLYLINAKRRMFFGRDQINPPSRFVKEIGESVIESMTVNDDTFKTKFNKEDAFYEDDVTFKVGDKIEHSKYERGIVVEIEGDILNVAFKKEFGIKKLLKNHKSVKKL